MHSGNRNTTLLFERAPEHAVENENPLPRLATKLSTAVQQLQKRSRSALGRPPGPRRLTLKTELRELLAQ